VTGLPVTQLQTMREVVAISASRDQIYTSLMTIFAAAALLLAAIGIYGLMAYSVQQRVQEIGIRLSLGADTSNVRNMVIRQGMQLVAIGTVVGLIAAYFLANVLASALYEVQPRDLTAFIGVPLILALISLAAVSIPAYRASLVDPLEALRYE
jgi:putative ABC transport system permease protein